jgi:hypothetical protein
VTLLVRVPLPLTLRTRVVPLVVLRCVVVDVRVTFTVLREAASAVSTAGSARLKPINNTHTGSNEEKRDRSIGTSCGERLQT